MLSIELGSRIAARRKELGFTQSQFAEQLDVTFQTVSGWERGETTPNLERIPAIARALQTSAAYLLDGVDASELGSDPKEKLFDEEHMFTYIKSFANSRGLLQTQQALVFARAHHEGQWRKGSGKIPYISHPLNMTCHALALGMVEDDLLATALLHDVCEDCGVPFEGLPAGNTVQKAVELLTFTNPEGLPEHDAKVKYFSALSANREAVMVKLLDRCNNVSFMVHGFLPEKLREYIEETREFILPLLEQARKRYPEYNNALYLLKYHICSVINSVEHVL